MFCPDNMGSDGGFTLLKHTLELMRRILIRPGIKPIRLITVLNTTLCYMTSCCMIKRNVLIGIIIS